VRNLGVDECIAFQDVFFDPVTSTYSPYEQIQDPESYYPMALIGEVGSFLNAYSKRDRSLNDYTAEVEDEAVDMFLYLIMTPKIVCPDKPELFSGIKADWNMPPQPIDNDAALTQVAVSCVNGAARFSHAPQEAYTADHLRDMFGLIKSMAGYACDKDWQTIINTAHAQYAHIRTRPDEYTPDLRTKGAGYQNFALLLAWIERNEISMPVKRLDFLGRMAALQCVHEKSI